MIEKLKNLLKLKDLMPIEMVRNHLKYFLLNECIFKTKNDRVRGIRKFWQMKMNDIGYCNSKFDHITKVVDSVIDLCGRATGL